MKKIRLPSKFKKKNILLFVMLFATGGVILLGISFAGVEYTPHGEADYCSLESGNTVIYGWAHDDNAPAGPNPYVTVRLSSGQTTKVPTDRAGYRDAQINQQIAEPEYTPSSVYGFRAQFSGIYKGSAPTLTGTAHNYGAIGAGYPAGDPGDIPLYINSYGSKDGSSLPYFAGGKIPDACLAPAPIPILPSPSTTSSPTPNSADPPSTDTVAPSTTKPASPNTTPSSRPTTIPAPAAISENSDAIANQTNDDPAQLSAPQEDSQTPQPRHTTQDFVQPASSRGFNRLIILIPLVLIVSGAIGLWLLRRRSNPQDAYDSEYEAMDYTPAPQPTIPNQPTPDPNPNHIGESLKDMVIKSMREAAQKKAEAEAKIPK